MNYELAYLKQKELIESFAQIYGIHGDYHNKLYAELVLLEKEEESEEKEEEFHVWVIPERKEIYVEDRGCGVPVGATNHVSFDSWDGAVKLGKFLAEFCKYELELDNDAGRFAEEQFNN